jgi:hypothetical protein
MADNIPPAQSRMEELLHRQIELQEETNRLLADIRRRLPAFTITPITDPK